MFGQVIMSVVGVASALPYWLQHVVSEMLYLNCVQRLDSEDSSAVLNTVPCCFRVGFAFTAIFRTCSTVQHS
jgi:hypothetical protein